MKKENPIEEIWRIRGELGAAEGCDVRQLFYSVAGTTPSELTRIRGDYPG